ncbi:ferrochelatase [Sulfurimonas marina]|uniref:Ferrochelatase n=1 Tax=Sulfurimonas marina TaxID=2590551 RepID=A0A7M3V9F6_9BACT|nr:ferrochelatase [Sulfurimonas marina]QOP40389.1 ferrochelatase [Sulfurimonas marina]
MKNAILLLNMGGPNNLDEVEVFLNNMFNDKRIISAPKPIRYLIAKLITFKRKGEARENYKALGGKSPIVKYTHKLISDLHNSIKDASIHMVMRYTPPFAKDVLQELKGVENIYAIPLYPHFSSTTTLSSYDDLEAELKRNKIKVNLKKVDAYYNDPYYNNAIVERIQESLNGEDPTEYELVFSAHGLPKKIIEKGDSYQEHIKRNVYHARKALVANDIHFYKTHLAYQSRLGPMEWIKPYLDEKLKTLQKKKVIIYPIAFTIDNSETEFELDVEYKEIADELGFDEYRVAKAPNNHPEFVKCITNIYENLKEK